MLYFIIGAIFGTVVNMIHTKLEKRLEKEKRSN